MLIYVFHTQYQHITVGRRRQITEQKLHELVKNPVPFMLGPLAEAESVPGVENLYMGSLTHDSQTHSRLVRIVFPQIWTEIEYHAQIERDLRMKEVAYHMVRVEDRKECFFNKNVLPYDLGDMAEVVYTPTEVFPLDGR